MWRSVFPCLDSINVVGGGKESNLLNLTEDQRILLKSTWSDDANEQSDLAWGIYEELFRLDPNLKQLFPSLGHSMGHSSQNGQQQFVNAKELSANDSEIELQKNRTFTKMALKLVQILAFAVKNVMNLESVQRQLRSSGAMHAKLLARGLELSHFNLMEIAILNTIRRKLAEKSDLNAAAQTRAMDAWAMLIGFIVYEVRHSCETAMARQISLKSKKKRKKKNHDSR